MKEQQALGLDFLIDRLTNSIENVQSGDTFPTEVSLLTTPELKNITRQNGWRFNYLTDGQLYLTQFLYSKTFAFIIVSFWFS